MSNPPADKPVEQLMGMQWFEHKGEMLMVFSGPVPRWGFDPETALHFGQALVAFAERHGAGKGTKQ